MTTPVEAARPGLGSRLVTFYHDVIAEMKKVTWPDRPQLQSATIQIIVFVLVLGAVIGLVRPSDITTRIIGQKLAERFKQPVVIDNRAGAGGTVGAKLVAAAAPDGYTLLVITSSV